MSNNRRPPVVARWLRIPLWFLLAGSALAALLFLSDVRTAQQERAHLDNGYHLTALIDPSWDGRSSVPLTYTHPQTHEVVRATPYVWNDSLPPKRVGAVYIDVSRLDPKDVRIAGDRFPATTNIPSYLPWVALPLIVWVTRRRTIRTTEELMASAAPAYAMEATLSRGPFQLRPRLQLFALDTIGRSQPTCRVSLIDRHLEAGTFTVEVKGTPRAFGRVVARTAEGEILWPSGRGLLH